MIVNFYSCCSCGGVREERQWIASVKCQTCGGKKMQPVFLNPIRLFMFVLCNPSYLVKAVKGE
jgi:hypothetical protein